MRILLHLLVLAAFLHPSLLHAVEGCSESFQVEGPGGGMATVTVEYGIIRCSTPELIRDPDSPEGYSERASSCAVAECARDIQLVPDTRFGVAVTSTEPVDVRVSINLPDMLTGDDEPFREYDWGWLNTGERVCYWMLEDIDVEKNNSGPYAFSVSVGRLAARSYVFHVTGR